MSCRRCMAVRPEWPKTASGRVWWRQVRASTDQAALCLRLSMPGVWHRVYHGPDQRADVLNFEKTSRRRLSVCTINPSGLADRSEVLMRILVINEARWGYGSLVRAVKESSAAGTEAGTRLGGRDEVVGCMCDAHYHRRCRCPLLHCARYQRPAWGVSRCKPGLVGAFSAERHCAGAR